MSAMPGIGAAPPPPPGWSAHINPADGRTYYHNPVTMVTQYEYPMPAMSAPMGGMGGGMMPMGGASMGGGGYMGGYAAPQQPSYQQQQPFQQQAFNPTPQQFGGYMPQQTYGGVQRYASLVTSAQPCIICTGIRPTPATSAPSLRSPTPAGTDRASTSLGDLRAFGT